MFDANFFRTPRLRGGTDVHFHATRVAISMGDIGCDIEFPPEGRTQMAKLLEMLQVGATVKGLRETCPDADDGAVILIMSELDRLGLLTDATPDKDVHPYDGPMLYLDQLVLIHKTKDRLGQCPFFARLVDGSLGRGALIGYVIEYYHITAAALGSIAPALSHAASPRRKRLVRDFLLSEVGHDDLMARALESVGIDRHCVDTMMPLPATFAICAQTGVLASSDPISFYCILRIMEEANPTFHQALVQHAHQLGLPDTFVAPLLRHASINDGGRHSDICGELLADISHVGSEQASVALRHTVLMLETIALMGKQILKWHGSADEPRLRLFGC